MLFRVIHVQSSIRDILHVEKKSERDCVRVCVYICVYVKNGENYIEYIEI